MLCKIDMYLRSKLHLWNVIVRCIGVCPLYYSGDSVWSWVSDQYTVCTKETRLESFVSDKSVS